MCWNNYEKKGKKVEEWFTIHTIPCAQGQQETNGVHQISWNNVARTLTSMQVEYQPTQRPRLNVKKVLMKMGFCNKM